MASVVVTDSVVDAIVNTVVVVDSVVVMIVAVVDSVVAVVDGTVPAEYFRHLEFDKGFTASMPSGRTHTSPQ